MLLQYLVDSAVIDTSENMESRRKSYVPPLTDNDLEDPMCNADNPHKITFEDVSSAAYRIRGGIKKTLLAESHLGGDYGIQLYLKNDFQQFTGSFKERGARNALLLLSDEQKATGVISASLGNHSQALSYHGFLLNIPVTVVMPTVAPIMKIQRCRDFKANVVVAGDNMTEAKAIAIKMAKEKGLTYINGYDHPHIMAGQGTIGLEILEDIPDVEAVIVPVGGGGLIAGVATAIKSIKKNVKIYGVESEKCPSMDEAMRAGKPVCTTLLSTLADGLAVPTVGYNAYITAVPLIDKMIVVKEEWIAQAILKLVEMEKCVVEGGGAAGIAAIMADQVPELAGKKVACILSGGNIDSTILGRCLERGLAAEYRLIKFKVTVSDRPGGIAELCRMIASIGVSIKDIMHERAWVASDIFSVQVKVVGETRGLEHTVQLQETLEKNYHNVIFCNANSEDAKTLLEKKQRRLRTLNGSSSSEGSINMLDVPNKSMCTLKIDDTTSSLGSSNGCDTHQMSTSNGNKISFPVLKIN